MVKQMKERLHIINLKGEVFKMTRKMKMRKDEFIVDNKIKRKDYRHMIGDFKFPNKYWVSWSNDFYVCENGSCDWVGDKIKNWKSIGQTKPEPFDTFESALRFAQSKIDEIPSVPTMDSINCVHIEDRLSGQVFEGSIFAYVKKNIDLLNKNAKHYIYKFESRNETNFTQKTMESKGYEFR